jgi:hypothetical protein
MTTVLYEDEFVRLTIDPDAGLVRYDRTDVPYGGADDMDRSYAGIAATVARILPGMKLLIDIRRAPPRNDAMYEAKLTSVLDSFVSRFGRSATLVRTAVGKLQTKRIAQARGTDVRVFDDEDAALAYLGVRGKTQPPRDSPGGGRSKRH